MLIRTVLVAVSVALLVTGCGGTAKQTIVLKAIEPSVTAGQLAKAAAIERARLEGLRVHSATVRAGSGNELRIELPRESVSTRLRRVVTKRGRFEIYDLEADVSGPSLDASGHVVSTPTLFQLLEAGQTAAKSEPPAAFYLFDARKRPVAGPDQTRAGLRAEARARSVTKGQTVMAVPGGRTVISCDAKIGCPGVRASAGTFYYLLKSHPALTGADLKRSQILADVGTGGHGAIVRLGFTVKGGQKFHEITRAEARRAQAAATAAGEGAATDLATVARFAQHFAIALDGELRSTPYIDYKQNPDGVDPTGTGAEISNINTFGEAKDLALFLRTGELPVKLVPVG